MIRSTLFPERDLLLDAIRGELDDFRAPPVPPLADDLPDDEAVPILLARLNRFPETHADVLSLLNAYRLDAVTVVLFTPTRLNKYRAVAHCRLRLRTALHMVCREHNIDSTMKENPK